MKLKTRIQRTFTEFQKQMRNKTVSLLVINSFLIVIEYIYILFRYKYLNDAIPFWYTKMWGDYQLASKAHIYLIPLVSLVVLLIGALILIINRYYIQHLTGVIWIAVTLSNLFLMYSIFRIIQISSMPFEPLINPLYLNLVPPFLLAFIAMFILMPIFIDYANLKKLVTNPKVHEHPGMVLESPSARGAGFVYGIVFLLLGFLYVGLREEFIGLFLSVLMVSVLGIIDDYQNTHPSSSFKIFEKPILRLFLLFVSILPVILSGVLIEIVSNPFGGVVNLNDYQLQVGDNIIPIISALFTGLWMVWVMNVLSWSNGIDGQYAGIVGIASIVIAFLALRFEPLEFYYVQIAMLGAISAGAAFGTAKYTWFPSKIMWGFGAMVAGLLISVLSIKSQSKIAVSVMIILIPFLDAVVTFIRRVLQRKNPLAGDKGHLHHLLLARGWGIKKIAFFYWITTALFGFIGLLTPERIILQISLIVAGIVAFIIVLLNVSFLKKKKNVGI